MLRPSMPLGGVGKPGCLRAGRGRHRRHPASWARATLERPNTEGSEALRELDLLLRFSRRQAPGKDLKKQCETHRTPEGSSRYATGFSGLSSEWCIVKAHQAEPRKSACRSTRMAVLIPRRTAWRFHPLVKGRGGFCRGCRRRGSRAGAWGMRRLGGSAAHRQCCQGPARAIWLGCV